jgi:hypothetical protein
MERRKKRSLSPRSLSSTGGTDYTWGGNGEAIINDKQLPREESEDSELSYFELQAYVGTTKHMGGFEATKALIISRVRPSGGI